MYSDNVGVEKHQKSPEFRLWSRKLIHTVIESVLAPIEMYMRTGIKLRCADGADRRCFPVLCEYIADMEEQWLLGCLKKPSCPKCYIGINSEETVGSHHGRVSDSIHHSRTDVEASRIRLALQNDKMEPQAVYALGYHQDAPFSVNYPLGGILDAVGPDLLHQVSKCFMDYLLSVWILPLMLKFWAKKKISAKDLEIEIDSRFALIPGYPNLRRFANGIFTDNHHWTVHEYKAMMKVILATLVGICPPEGLAFVREYLHIHRLSHYPIHSDKTLNWLRSAIDTFWKILKAPGGVFVQNGLVAENYHVPQQRLHYFHHYAQSVMEKGALPSYSTDRTEIWHKPLKAAYRRSNKNKVHAERYILMEQTRLSAFQAMVEDLELEEAQGEGTEYDQSRSTDSGVPTDSRVISSESTETCGAAITENPTEELDELYDRALSQATIARTVTWPKRPRKGWPLRASKTETKLNLPGFSSTLRRYIQNLSSSTSTAVDSRKKDRDIDPLVHVYDGVVIRYPSWTTEELGRCDSVQRSRDDHELKMGNEYILPSKHAMIVERIRAGAEGHTRRDCVLITWGKSSRGQMTSMSERRVGQVLALFKSRQWMDGSDMKLAYISLFETMKGPDPNSGLYLLRRTKKMAVIDIEDIERGVHLIPKFGHQVGATEGVKRTVDVEQMRVGMEADVGNARWGDSAVTVTSWLNVIPHYEEFWLNIWIDNHLYKTIW